MAKILERACLLCEKEDAEPLLVQKGKSFVRCRHCGLIYQDPPPLPEESRQYYEKSYYETFGDRAASIDEARLSLYRGFLSECANYRRTGRLLDIGCGYGGFLRMAQEEGWDVWGVEPSWEASQSAEKNLGIRSRILNEILESVDFPENHFDVITLWNVIDCLPDPAENLRKIRRWLSPGGLLLIRTPNSLFHLAIFRLYASVGPLLKRLGWNKEASVFLRANFDAKTLQKLLQVADFSAVQISNGEPTSGDAYQVFSRSNIAVLAKKGIYGASCVMSFISGGRLLTGSTLIARASKGMTQARLQPATMRFRIVLKSWVLHALALAGYLLGLPLWLRIFGKDRQARILLYHSVHELRKNDVNVRESQFRKQLDFLQARYSVMALEEVVAALKKRNQLPRRCVAIAFDDGYKDNYQVAFPLLKEKGFPATIFLLTGERRETDRQLTHLVDDQPQYNRLLSWDEVREMTAAGIRFGSHGQTHALLSELGPSEVRREVFRSKELIESETGRPVPFFSYPYGTGGDFDRRVEWWVREAGYQAAFSRIFGTNGKGANPYALRRMGIEASDTLFTFRAKLNGALGLLSLFDLPAFRRIVRRLDSFFLGGSPRNVRKNTLLLLVSVDFPPHTDGVSTISQELSGRIARRGPQVFVIGPKDKGDEVFDAAQPYQTFRMSGYAWGYLRFIPILFRMPWVVWRFGIRKVFAMNIAYGGILCWILSFFCGLEYLIFAYGYEFEKVKKVPFARILYRSIYRRAKGIVACSDLVKERLVLFGGERAKIKVLYPAVDLERYRPLKVPGEYLEKKNISGRRMILTVGRLIERKGHDQVLRALPRILQSFPDVLYGIVGMGPYEKKLREEAERLRLGPHVRFLGRVLDEELIWLYNACELFVMPSREISEEGHIEGFGIVYLEASACGKPVIGGKSGGISEAIREEETGFLVDPNSPDEIAEKVVFLLSHPEKGLEMGRRGLQWVRETFHWERYTEQAYQWLYGEPLP